MLKKKFKNNDLGIELTSYIDKQQNVWFRGKDVGEILKYSNVRNAICKYVDSEDKKQIFTYHTSVPKMSTVASNTSVPKMSTVASNTSVPKMGPLAPSGSMCTYINESGFLYNLISIHYYIHV